MFEKVNPAHPDKIADRIAGAIVDYAYFLNSTPKIAVEVLIGHGECNIIAETSEKLKKKEIVKIVYRITGNTKMKVRFKRVPQDIHLASNQSVSIRCGDNGIFKGSPVTAEQAELAQIARQIYASYPYDGKYIKDSDKLIICQSHLYGESLDNYPNAIVNPLGPWTGGTDVDSGATNRKLGSDMGDGVTGGGLHGKDLSKADVSVNIYAHLKAQECGNEVKLFCAIGDETIDGRPYAEIVEIARNYIKSVGGFEKFAEWGLI